MALLGRLELDQIEQQLNSFKLTELQPLIAELGGAKFGKKGELITRIMAFVRDPVRQQRSMQLVRSYQNRSMRPGPPVAMGNRYGGYSMPGFSGGAYQGYAGHAAMQRAGGTVKYLQNFQAVSLPFFDVVERLLPAVELSACSPVHQKISTTQAAAFTIPQNYAQSLSYRGIDTYPLPRHEVQMRFFLLNENWQNNPQNDEFPLNCSVRVNDFNVPLPPIIPSNRQNQEPKRPSRPLNITPAIQQTGHIHQTPYQVRVEWLADKRVWAFEVNLVYRVNSKILIERLTNDSARLQAAESTKQVIIRRLSNGDDDVCLTTMKASIKCPLTRTRLRTPVRCRDCDHLQCFDLENYIQMNEKKPTWKCPVCPRLAPFSRLIVDGYFVDVLKETRNEVEEVELLSDGGWKVLSESVAEELSDDDDDDSFHLASNSEAKTVRDSTDSAPPPNKKAKAMDEIITLEDSDEDDDLVRATQASLETATAAPRVEKPAAAPVSASPSVSSPSEPTSSSSVIAAAPPPTTPTRKEIEIITLDDTPPRSAANRVSPGLRSQSTDHSAAGSSNPQTPATNDIKGAPASVSTSSPDNVYDERVQLANVRRIMSGGEPSMYNAGGPALHDPNQAAYAQAMAQMSNNRPPAMGPMAHWAQFYSTGNGRGQLPNGTHPPIGPPYPGYHGYNNGLIPVNGMMTGIDA
ncbi:unnamed protein product, partial [Mesorhabditis spiculigera]